MVPLATSRIDFDRVASLGSGRGGRPRATNRGELISTALAVLSREGLAGLTFRRVAEELGVGVSTVHNAFGSKEDLLQAIADDVLSQIPAEATGLYRPRETLTAYLLAVHRLLMRYPAVAQLSVVAPMRNESVFRMQEQIVQALRACGLDMATVATAYVTISSWLFGFTLTEIAADSRTRRDLIAALPRDRFPGLRELAATYVGRSTDERFTEGLGRVLDGFGCAPDSPAP